MKLLVVHLSDMHIQVDSILPPNLVADICNAVRLHATGADACLVAITGDVAYSGRAAEYAIALDFFRKLLADVAAIRPGLQVVVASIPGNHDCDHSVPNQVRNVLVREVLDELKTGQGISQAVADTCAGVESAFFGFLRELHPPAPLAPQEGTPLYWEGTLELGAGRVRVRCFNSAWMSQKVEVAGTLAFPVTLSDVDEPSGNLTITLIHHPYNWYHPQQGRAVRKSVEDGSDLILTGHEHVLDHRRVSDDDGTTRTYVEGGALLGDNAAPSSFNLVLIDLGEMTYTLSPVAHDGARYAASETATSLPLLRNRREGNWASLATESFADELDDAGAAFSHPAKDVLFLSDFFVWPDVRNVSGPPGGADGDARSGRAISYFLTHPRWLVSGVSTAGKTSFARRVCASLLGENVPPLLVNGASLGARDVRKPEEFLRARIAAQYGAASVDSYLELPREKRALVIDDFDLARLNGTGRNALLGALDPYFKHILVLVSDRYSIEELMESDAEGPRPIEAFERGEIALFGHRLRGALIEKWVTLGGNLDLSDRERDAKVRSAETVVDTLILRSALPPLPGFILIVLQANETNINLSTAAGSFGQYYELLITQALARHTRHVSLDVAYNAIAAVAWHSHSSKARVFDEAALRATLDRYKAEYKVNFSVNEMVRMLLSARILRLLETGEYRFEYNYIYYYFVAKYLAERLSGDSAGTLRERISYMVERVHVEAFANILVFFIYLTKDGPTIESMLARSRTLLPGTKACAFEEDTRFLGDLITSRPALALPAGTIREHREEHRTRLDEAEGMEREAAESEEGGEDAIGEAAQMNTAVKTLQVLGQVARNFPGSLPGARKIEIVTECYSLGLRVTGFVFGALQVHLDELIRFARDFLEKQKEISDERELDRQAREFVHWLFVMIAYASVKRISMAVGSEELRDTYAGVPLDASPVGVRLTTLAVKLDHFNAFPEAEVLSLYSEVENNALASMMIRRLVRDHLYLYSIDYRTRQRLCAKLDIADGDPEMIGGDRRLLRE
jgi:Calcineurin-like phosphoesterase